MVEMILITDYDQFFRPIVTKIHIGPIFTGHEHSDTKIAFFRHTYQEKIDFVQDPFLSQQHALVGFGNWCFAYINGHLNGLIGETMN